MSVLLGSVLIGLGFVGAFVSGLLGVGGAIIMIPLLLYGPPLLGAGRLDVKAVAGVTMAQVFVAAVSGTVAHRRHDAVDSRLAWVGGISMATGSLAGALGSKYVADTWLLLTLALMATSAVILMLLPIEMLARAPAPASPGFSRSRVALVSGGVGLVAGLIGAGGAFLLVPLLLVYVRLPVRTTIASSLGITALGATAGFVGKLATGQVPLLAALMVALGALPGAQAGAAVSHRMPESWLKQALLWVVALAAARVWWDVFAR